MAVSYKPLSISFEKWLWFQTLIFGTYLNNNKLAIALIMQYRRKEGLFSLIQFCQFNETHYELNRMPTPFFTPPSTILSIYHFLLFIVFIYLLAFFLNKISFLRLVTRLFQASLTQTSPSHNATHLLSHLRPSFLYTLRRQECLLMYAVWIRSGLLRKSK